MIGGPTCIISALGVWHFVNSIKEEEKKKLYKEEIEEIKLNQIQKQRRQGLESYLHYLERIPLEQEKEEQEIIGCLPFMITSTSIDYAICAFTLAMVCEIIFQNGFQGMAWLLATPLAAIGLITVYYSLFNIFE